jgi:hypothetical protein
MTYSRFSERQLAAGPVAAPPVAEGGTMVALAGVAHFDALPVPAAHVLDCGEAR